MLRRRGVIVARVSGGQTVITQTTITEGQEDLADASGLHLLAISPEIFTAQLLPGAGVITVGRSSRCTIQVEDPMVSREHVRLHVQVEDDVLSLAIEDPGSANGTRVREAVITRGERVPIAPGEEVGMGTTVLMVLDNRGPRRIRSHAYFEARVADECARAGETGRAFALARLRFAPEAPWNRVLPLLARGLRAPHVFAAYGPRDYEILFVDVDERDVDATIAGLLQASHAAGLEATCGVAWYPKNGKTSDALLGTANALLSVRRDGPPEPERARIDTAPMQRVRDMAARVAASPINVLIVGECGVGKDVLAQLIHKLSPRAGKPFMALNCAALTATLLESELFGYEKGAFTGALAAKAGLLEAADGGTVFLDEVGDMPAAMQASLLRVIEAREVRPIGALKSRPIDVRFISATNKDLDGAVTKGQFRDDLMFRLDVMRLKVPPLRERTDEIPALATTFVANACLDAGRNGSLLIAEEVMELLIGYRWPGNIRELKNVMERAVALCDGPEILPEHLPLERMGSPVDLSVTQRLQREAPSIAAAEATLGLPPLTDPEKLAERQRIIDALVASNWNQTRAAQKLGMPRRTFVSKLDQFGIPRPQKSAPAE
jgi:two-component system, NtrC family, response regulator AtoC